MPRRTKEYAHRSHRASYQRPQPQEKPLVDNQHESSTLHINANGNSDKTKYIKRGTRGKPLGGRNQ